MRWGALTRLRSARGNWCRSAIARSESSTSTENSWLFSIAGNFGGEFMGVEGTGRIVDFTSTAVLRIEDDQIAQAWDEMDTSWLTH
jgi:hypothetical protein